MSDNPFHSKISLGRNSDHLDNARSLVEGWWAAAKHLPEEEQIERLALCVGTLFRDKSVRHEDAFEAHLLIAMVDSANGHVQIEVTGSSGNLVRAIVEACSYEDTVGELLKKSVILYSLKDIVKKL